MEIEAVELGLTRAAGGDATEVRLVAGAPEDTPRDRIRDQIVACQALHLLAQDGSSCFLMLWLSSAPA